MGCWIHIGLRFRFLAFKRISFNNIVFSDVFVSKVCISLCKAGYCISNLSTLFLLLLAGATDFYWAMNVTYHIEWSLRCEGRALVVYDLTKSKSVNPVIKLHWQLVENKYPSSLFFPGSLFELLMNNGKIFVTILHLETFLPIFRKLFFSIPNLNSF